MPDELVGLDVLVEPQVPLSGDGAGRYAAFGPALASSVEARLIGEGFDVVPQSASPGAVRVQLRANVSISHNALINVNGKPLETTDAQVGIRVLAADGSLLVAFQVEGDPDSETANDVATQLAHRMKGSSRLVAVARSQQKPTQPIVRQTPDDRSVAEATPAKTRAVTRSKPKRWPDISSKLAGQSDGSGDAAVIVAIENYQELLDVPGARANGEAWFNYLFFTRGVKRERIHVLFDDDARDKQITTAVAEAAREVKKGGKFWFVFIGHGAPKSDQQGLLVGYDAYGSAEGLADRSVNANELLRSLSGIDGTPVVVLDACFSGRSRSENALVAGLQPSSVVRTTVPENALILTAARGDQFAGALPGEERPAFSYLLLGALRGWADRDGSGTITAKEAEQYVGDTLRVVLTGARKQTPTLEGGRQDFVLSASGEEEPPAIQELLGSKGKP